MLNPTPLPKRLRILMYKGIEGAVGCVCIGIGESIGANGWGFIAYVSNAQRVV